MCTVAVVLVVLEFLVGGRKLKWKSLKMHKYPVWSCVNTTHEIAQIKTVLFRK